MTATTSNFLCMSAATLLSAMPCCAQYSLIHRLETNKLRNVAKFFAHLLSSDAISWEVFQVCALACRGKITFSSACHCFLCKPICVDLCPLLACMFCLGRHRL
jgi:hypothetical protein